MGTDHGSTQHGITHDPNCELLALFILLISSWMLIVPAGHFSEALSQASYLK